VVIAERFHRNFGPRLVVLMTITDNRGDGVVTVSENIGLDYNTIPGDSLRCKPSALEFRLHSPNDNAFRRPIAHVQSVSGQSSVFSHRFSVISSRSSLFQFA